LQSQQAFRCSCPQLIAEAKGAMQPSDGFTLCGLLSRRIKTSGLQKQMPLRCKSLAAISLDSGFVQPRRKATEE
jgi:hypothetical protein